MEIKEKDIKKTKANILLSGDLTIYQVKKFRDEFVNYLNKFKSLVVDLSEVKKFDSSGFQLLLYFKKEGQRLKKKVLFENHSDVVTRIIELYGGVGSIESD